MKRAAVWLVLLLLMSWSVWRFTQPEVASQTHVSLVAPNISQVAAIDLVPASGVHIRLKKQDETWVVSGSPDAPANAEPIQHLLDDLATMRVIRVVTHTHTHDEELGMNQGVTITLLDQTGSALFILRVGKQGTDLISTYVRIGQAAEIVAVNKSLVWQVKRGSNAWKAPSQSQSGTATNESSIQDKKKAILPEKL